jgi:hypothetical protein
MDCYLIWTIRKAWIARNAEISRSRKRPPTFIHQVIRRGFFYRTLVTPDDPDSSYRGLSFASHEHNHDCDSSYDPINYIGILPFATLEPSPSWVSIYLYLRRYLYPDWQTPRGRIKGEDIRF